MKMRKRRKAFWVDFFKSATRVMGKNGEWNYRYDQIKFYFQKRFDARKPK